MNGNPASDPLSSNVAKISSRERTSTMSPIRSRNVWEFLSESCINDSRCVDLHGPRSNVWKQKLPSIRNQGYSKPEKHLSASEGRLQRISALDTVSIQ